MALRLRRGTDAERQIITLAAGEPYYTSDTKNLYVGDGTTAGGIPVDANSLQSINSLQDVDTQSISPVTGWVLKWDGSNWIPAEETATSSGVVEGSNYRINIVGDDSSVIVDTTTNTIIGDLFGDITGNLFGNVISADGSTILVNAGVGTFTGDLTGNVFGELNGNVNSPNIGAMVDVTSGDMVTGNITVSRILTGDSTVFYDANQRTVYTEKIKSTNEITILTDQARSELRILSDDNRSILKLSRQSTGDISGIGAYYGAIYFEREDDVNNVTTSLILGGNERMLFSVTNDGIVVAEETFNITNTGIGWGTVNPQAGLEIVGDAIISGTIDAASFRGSLVSDDSTIMIDAINNTITSGGYIQFGSYTTTTRDEIAAANGMIVYNTTTNRFNGYQNSAWINLDDGTAA